jgi:CRP-like cAMP-binding protein
LNEHKAIHQTDFDRLTQLKPFSRLSIAELKLLAGTLALASYKQDSVILRGAALAQDAHILLAGIARVTCLNPQKSRVTVAMLAPGPMPEFPAQPSQSGFQCEAYSDCRVGSLRSSSLGAVSEKVPEFAFKAFHRNDLKQWYRLLLRSSSFLNLALHDRIAVALLELCSDFGIEDARGTLLRVSFSNQNIANLVDAPRLKVSEHLARLELEKLVIREGRQMVVQVDRLSESMGSRNN